MLQAVLHIRTSSNRISSPFVSNARAYDFAAIAFNTNATASDSATSATANANIYNVVTAAASAGRSKPMITGTGKFCKWRGGLG